MRKYLIAALATGFTLGAIFFSATPVSAQVAGSLWKLTANYLYPVNSLWGVAVPSLANNPCIGTDSSGKFEAGTCPGGSGTVTQINTTYPITGGPITTTGTIGLSGYATTTLVAGTNITLSGTPVILGASPITINATGGSTGLSTTSPLASSNLLVYSNSGAGSAYGVATSTLTASSPLTGSLTVVGSGGSLGCQTASGSQAGCLSSTDWNTFNGKGSGSVTSIVAGLGLNGGTITTSGTIALKSYIATSSVETSGYIPYWTSSAGTPALLSGGLSALTFDGTRLNFTYGSTTALSASGTIYADNFYDTSLMGSTCVGESGGLLESSTYCVTSVSGTWPILSSGGTNPVISWAGLGTTTPFTAGQLAEISNSNTIFGVSTSSPTNGTGITLSGTGSVVGGSLSITNSSPLSGLTATFPFSFSNPTLTWLGLATSTALTAGNPIYATGVNTIGQVASSTFLASIGGITSAITALGPVGQTQTGATQTLATSTNTTNGLTSALQIIGSGNTQTFTPSISGTLTVAGGGTGIGSVASDALLYGSGSTALNTLAAGTNGYVLAMAGGVPTWTATSSITGAVSSVSNSDNTLTISPTTGAVVASINLTHANAWTGLQQFNANASTTGLTDTGNAYFPFSAVAQSNFAVMGTTTPFGFSEGGATVYAPSLSIESVVDPVKSWVGAEGLPGFAPTLVSQVLGEGGSSGNYTAAILGYGSTTKSLYPELTASLAGMNAGPVGTGNSALGAAVYANQLSTFSSSDLAYSVYALGGANYFQDNVGIGTSTPGTLLSIGNTTGWNFSATGTSTETGAAGINLLAGCYAINGTCLTSGGSGTVTSVGLSSTNSTLTIGSTPVTTSGTITADLNLAHPNAWTGIQTFSAPLGIGSSTPFFALSVGTGATAFYISTSTGEVVGYDKQSGYVGQISPVRYLPFTLATSTGWVGTSTNASFYGDSNSIIAPFTGTIKAMNCATSAGTLNVEASTTSGVNTIYQGASSTPALLNFSLAMTQGQLIYLTAGTPASSPAFVSCTATAIQTP